MIDISRYKDLDKLKEINQQVIDIIVGKDLLSSEKFKRNHLIVVGEELATANWNCVLLYSKSKKEQIDLSYVDYRFKVIQDQCKEIDSLINVSLNFVGPNSFTPLHNDDSAFIDSNGDTMPGSNDTTRSLQILTGVYMPSTNIRDNGIFVDNIPYTWSTENFLAFNGQTPHWGWNITDKPRISLYVDVTEESFLI